MAKLRFTSMSFSEIARQAWIRGDYGILKRSRASRYLRRVLPTKAKKRRKRRATDRFFGEAYVSAKLARSGGYYGSFRWLTNSYFLSRPSAANRSGTDREQLRWALWDQFDEALLTALHERARRVARQIGENPAPPDLWLFDNAGNHRFIEVKLPGDTVRPCQLAGLAVIARSLRSRTGKRVEVEVIDLHPDGMEPNKTKAFNRLLRLAG
ncbi:MAG: VRR-NUC domain-containing protein [Acidobacteriota bacterium]